MWNTLLQMWLSVKYDVEHTKYTKLWLSMIPNKADWNSLSLYLNIINKQQLNNKILLIFKYISFPPGIRMCEFKKYTTLNINTLKKFFQMLRVVLRIFGIRPSLSLDNWLLSWCGMHHVNGWP